MNYNVLIGVLDVSMVLLLVGFVALLVVFLRSVRLRDRINKWPQSVQVVVVALSSLACVLIIWLDIDVCYGQGRQMQAIGRNWLRISGMSQYPNLSSHAVIQAASAARMASIFFASAWIVPALCAVFLAWSLWRARAAHMHEKR